VCAACLGAQDAPARDWSGLEGRKLTLEECLAIARENSPALSKSQVGVQNADAGVIQAWSNVLPKVRNWSGYTRYDDDRFYFTGAGGLERSNILYSTRFSVEQPLFEGGGNIAQISSARAGRRAAKSEYRNARQDLNLLVQTRYIDLLQAQALLEVRQETVDVSRQHVERAEAFYRAGEKTQADVLRAKVELAQNELDLITARNSVRTARASLAHALGIPVGINLDVADLAEPVTPYDADLERDLEEAVELHPLLKVREASVEGAEADIGNAKSGRWPSISAGWSYQWNDIRISQLRGEDHRWSENAEWSLQLSMSFNIFDGRLTKANIRRAEAGLAYAREDLEQSHADVLLGVKQAHLDLVEADEKIRAAGEAVRLAEEDRRLQEERYRLGEGILIELKDALVALTNARVSQVQAVYEYHLARARLDRAVGRE